MDVCGLANTQHVWQDNDKFAVGGNRLAPGPNVNSKQCVFREPAQRRRTCVMTSVKRPVSLFWTAGNVTGWAPAEVMS